MSEDANKKTSLVYHEWKAENIEKILTPDFIGRHQRKGHTWDRENHKGYLAKNPGMTDTVHDQIAEGDIVATRFTRNMPDGREADAMHFKKFVDGKISEVWELFMAVTEKDT